jgi:integrase
MLRYTFEGRDKMIALGRFSEAFSLADARKRATELRALLDSGADPKAERAASRQKRREEEARAMTFKQCAEAFIATRPKHWKSETRKAQWRHSLEKYAFPVIGELSVPAIDEPLILKVLHQNVPALRTKAGEMLRPAGLFWNVRPETASKVRNRMELILDWARANKFRAGDNPARWRGNMDHLLGSGNAQAVQHLAALPYREVGEFLKDLRTRSGVASLALEFLILTAARTGEVLGATWGEIQEAQGVWTVPASRMKAGREHRVPLSPAALDVLERAKKVRRGDYIFPAARAIAPLSNMALLAVLKRMERTDITVHGFRSCFRDWAAEETTCANEVVEMALAHAIGSKVEAAYRRGDLFEKRKALMAAWADYCDGKSNVVNLSARAVA